MEVPDNNEARIDHDFVPEEIKLFMASLSQRLLEAVVAERVNYHQSELDVEVLQAETRESLSKSGYEKFQRAQLVERAKRIRASIVEVYNYTLLRAKLEDFTAVELIKALRCVTFADPIFLKGKLKTNLNVNMAMELGQDRIINSTKIVIKLKNGILVFGLTKDDLALSFAAYATAV